jgi:hypothetical protein
MKYQPITGILHGRRWDPQKKTRGISIKMLLLFSHEVTNLIVDKVKICVRLNRFVTYIV